MRRYIIGAVLGALAGLTMVFSVEVVLHCWDGGLERHLTKYFSAQNIEQARYLYVQAMFLKWIIDGGEIFSKIASCCALLGITIAWVSNLRSAPKFTANRQA